MSISWSLCGPYSPKRASIIRIIWQGCLVDGPKQTQASSAGEALWPTAQVSEHHCSSGQKGVDPEGGHLDGPQP